MREQLNAEHEHLTPRERDVLKLIVSEGLPTSEIAVRLGIAESTAKTYVGTLLRKFAVSKREQLVIAYYVRVEDLRRTKTEQASRKCGSCVSTAEAQSLALLLGEATRLLQEVSAEVSRLAALYGGTVSRG